MSCHGSLAEGLGDILSNRPRVNWLYLHHVLGLVGQYWCKGLALSDIVWYNIGKIFSFNRSTIHCMLSYSLTVETLELSHHAISHSSTPMYSLTAALTAFSRRKSVLHAPTHMIYTFFLGHIMYAILLHTQIRLWIPSKYTSSYTTQSNVSTFSHQPPLPSHHYSQQRLSRIHHSQHVLSSMHPHMLLTHYRS